VHAERILAQLLLLARIDEAASDPMQFQTIDLFDWRDRSSKSASTRPMPPASILALMAKVRH
jgi:uncharacterized protein involved in propanediol utilization